MLTYRVLDKRRIRRDEHDGWYNDGAHAVAPQDAEPPYHHGKDEELHDAAADSVGGEESPDAGGGDAEAPAEFEGEFRVRGVGGLLGVVHEDWEELVHGHAVEGEDGVGEEVEV